MFTGCLYILYRLIRGTVAFYMAVGLGLLYLLSFIFQWLSMNLMGTLMSRFSAFGFILLILVFQPEIRRFLLLLGSNIMKNRYNFLTRILNVDLTNTGSEEKPAKQSIVGAVAALAERKTGALIVFAEEEHLTAFKETGIRIDARISQMLIETIFEKKSPLHDGAMLIINKRIHSASCILPLSYDPSLPLKYGLRHRAAIGACEAADVFSIVVSEETGNITYFTRGKILELKSTGEVEAMLRKHGF